MKISRQVGTTSQQLNIFIQDATVSTGAGLANIVASSVSFSWFRNDQAAVSSGTCSSGGTLGTYAVSSLTQASSSLALGWYQFDPPDGLFTSGNVVALHLYGAPSMAPLPIEIELTKFNNQAYVSTYDINSVLDPVGVSSGTWVPTISSGVGVSSFAIRVGVSTLVGVSSGTWVAGVSTLLTEVGVSTIVPVGVSSKVGVSTLVGVSSGTWLAGVSTLTIPVGISSTAIEFGVSTIVPVGVSSKVGVSTLVGVSTITAAVGVSSFGIAVGVSSFAIAVGVSSNADKTNYTLDSTYGPAGSISTNIVQVKGIAITGSGTSSSPWGP